MNITSITGTVTRALPVAEGLEVKLATEAGTRTLSVPASRPDLILTMRAARMSGDDIIVRHTDQDEIVGTAQAGLARAA